MTFIDPRFRAPDNGSMLRPRSMAISVSIVRAAALLALALAMTGCGKKKQVAHNTPPPPSIEQPRTAGNRPVPAVDGRDYPKNTKVLYTETGTASWYGPPYHNRQAATGEIF